METWRRGASEEDWERMVRNLWVEGGGGARTTLYYRSWMGREYAA